MSYELLKFLHVATIIAAIVLAEGYQLQLLVVTRRRDVLGIRSTIWAGELGEKVANPLAALSIVFGVMTALNGGIDLTVSWLVASYAALAGAIGFGVVGAFRHLERLKAAAAASSVTTPSEELMSAIQSRWTMAGVVLPPLFMLILVYLLVAKPALW
jgi:hypothetical protein